MKICFLADASSIHAKRWITFFRDQGYECIILTFNKPADNIPGVRLYILKHPFRISYEHSNWQYLLQLPTIWGLIRRFKPDIVNAHFLSSYGFLAALACPKKVPLVISLYGSDILIIPKRSLLHRFVAIYSLKHAQLITSVAQHMTIALQQYISNQKPVLTMQYGINTQVFCPPLVIVDRAPIALSTRSMVKVSQLETLLQAALILKETQSPLRFDIAGNGELRSKLENLTVNLGLRKMVHFVGVIPPEQMPDTLHRMAIYISTSVSDGASLSLLEAMACGALPVVTDIPANREWITHGDNGLLTQPGSPEDLAEKLTQAWGDESLRQKAAKRNWEIIRERGDYQTNMSKIEQEFNKLIS